MVGDGLLAVYSGSLGLALREVLPEHNWELWRFDKVPQAFWKVKHNQRLYLEGLKQELKVKEMEDWLKVTMQDIERRGGTSSYSIVKVFLPRSKSNRWCYCL
jgi:hypothetical protein